MRPLCICEDTFKKSGLIWQNSDLKLDINIKYCFNVGVYVL